MRVLCAWCCREGQSGYLGEREPLDNPESTHGVCPSHKVKLLQSLPSRSFPEAEMLIVVRPDDAMRYEYLKRLFVLMPRVKVIVDRRVADLPRPERTRRVRQGTLLGGFTFVRFTPRVRLSDYGGPN